MTNGKSPWAGMNRAERRRNSQPGPLELPPGMPASSIVDLGQVAAQSAVNEKMKHAKLVLFPVGQMVEWLKMDGSYTLVSEGLPADAELLAMNPIPGQPYVGLLFYHPDWPERSLVAAPGAQNNIEILQIRWQRYNIKERGDAYNPAPIVEPPAG